jgi:flagellar biosynthetic protein FliR
VGLAATVAMILTPLVTPAAVTSLPVLVVGLCKEVIVGLVLGWTATLLFASVQMAGDWLDLHAGFQAAQVLNPAIDLQNALIGNFKYLLAGLVFLGTGSHAVMLRAAADSLTISPPGVLRLSLGTAGDWTTLLVTAVWIAVQLAAPMAAALFLAEVAIGLINRALPQVNVMILTLPVKAMLAVCALALCIPVLIRALGLVFSNLGPELAQVLRAMGR